MITVKRIFALLFIAISLNTHGMSYLKSWFSYPECLESKERKELFEGLKKNADEGTITEGKVLAITLKSNGADACVLGELGKAKQAELFKQFDAIMADTGKAGFYEPKNLSAIDKAYHTANDILRIIHLGSPEVSSTDRYKRAKRTLDILRDNYENAEDQARIKSASPAKKS